MILSFTKTISEFQRGSKTVTRRLMSERQTALWQSQYDRFGMAKLHKAYDKNPRNGGVCIGTFALTCRPYKEKLSDMPVKDLALEGGMVDSIEAFARLINCSLSQEVTVIRFETFLVVQ